MSVFKESFSLSKSTRSYFLIFCLYRTSDKLAEMSHQAEKSAVSFDKTPTTSFSLELNSFKSPVFLSMSFCIYSLYLVMTSI